MPTARRLIIDLSIMTAIGLLLAYLGPFGTFEARFPIRLLYWLLLAFGGYFVFLPAMRAATAAADRLDLPEAALWAGACVLASVPMTGVVWAANALLGMSAAPTLDRVIALYGNVLVIGAAVSAILWFASAHRQTDSRPIAQPPPPVAPPSAAPFLDRLPPHLGRDLIALEMEDHYVRAHTAHGSALILLRMRDAVAELDGIDGAQVHRSWWVARAAVTGVRREGRNIRLRLGETLEAPVARANVSELEAKAWL